MKNNNRWILWITAAVFISFAFLSADNGNLMKWQVPLNHFFLVTDSETYRAIENSEFLKSSFGVFEQRTTVRTDMTYTGLYFYGMNTYFEFFDVQMRTGSRIGDSAIAFGMDQPGAIQEFSKKLSWGETFTITREFNDRQVPWFLMSSPKEFPLSSGMSTWMMEYLPVFLREWHPEVLDGPQGIARKAILARYAGFLKQDPSKRLLKDVTGLTVAVDEDVRSKFVEYCSAFGYSMRSEGSITIAEGPDITFRFTPQSQPNRGIQQIEFRVSGSPSKQQEYRFGPKSVLKFESNGRAFWSF